MEMIQSVKNPKVQLWRSLRDAKGRKQSGSFLVEGVRLVREALLSSFPVREVLLRNDFQADPSLIPLLNGNFPVYRLADHVFQSVCDTRTPQGIAAVLGVRTLPLQGSALIALDGVQDPGNLGTIIRTADAAGMNGVLLSPECADLFSPKVLRAAMGSVFHLGFSFPEHLDQALMALKEKGFSILSSQLDGEPFFNRRNVRSSFVLVIGNEGNGVSDPVRRIATHRLCLPMAGNAESLNASVAAGIMMYDLMRFPS